MAEENAATIERTETKIEKPNFFDKTVRYFYRPQDPSSLGIIRFFYGFLMLMDISEERGGSEIDIRWGEPKDCHFPLIPFIKPLPLPYMGLIYGLMWIGALGITLGYKFQKSCILFAVSYWYILLIDKSYWNNHSYLFGICALLFLGTSSTHYFSVDGVLDKRKRNADVPYWNYFILKTQFFLLYFLAGLKKSDFEWLEGYAMVNLSKHWVFDPFKIFLATEQIDFLIVHWFGFLFDLTVGFWMINDFTKPYAMIFCITFHYMNSRLFSIGMFPYVCLATMPLFCANDWPKTLTLKIRQYLLKPKSSPKMDSRESPVCLYSTKDRVSWRHRFTVCSIFLHFGLQLFLPYSHFLTKGYNNWTNGLYGYSWDMMIHAWQNTYVVTKIVDNKNQQEHFLDPLAWTQNDRWTKHGDMMYQYAHCLKQNLINDKTSPLSSTNFSIYIDVWCSLNGRFQQRMFNPKYDLLSVNWSPFEPVEWHLPLLTEFSGWRTDLVEIQKHVYSWSNYSDVIFVADFPDLFLENYVAEDLTNVSLTVLAGDVLLEIPKKKRRKLGKGESVKLETGSFHRIYTISSTPSSYMYTYINQTKIEEETKIEDCPVNSPFPILEDLGVRVENMKIMFKIIGNCLLNLIFGVPIPRRVRVR